MKFLRDAKSRERLLLALHAVLLIVLLVRGIRSTWHYNDFEVYVYGAKAAWVRAPDLYTSDSTIKDRPFVYPPSAAVLMMPLGWVPYQAANVVFNVLKIAVFAAMVWGAVARSGLAPPERDRRLMLSLVTMVALLSPETGEFGNGQINAFVAASAFGGIWLMMGGERPRHWLGGSALLALAVAIKATPILLLAVPFLHRRWKAFAATLAFSALLAIGLPMAWFGPSMAKQLTVDFNASMREMVGTRVDEQSITSLYEAAQFTAGQVKADKTLVWDAKKERLYAPRPDGTRMKVSLPQPWTERTGKLVWLSIGMAVGAMFLLGRWRLSKRFAGAVPWGWDLAMLTVLMIALAPMVRRAHMIALVVPAGWIACALHAMMREQGARAFVAAHKWGVALLAGAALLTCVSLEVAVPIPGWVIAPQPEHFIGLLLLVASVAWLGSTMAEQHLADKTSTAS